MSTAEESINISQNAIAPEYVGAADLVACQVACMAAVGALSVGIAKSAFDMWMDALSGVTESTKKWFADAVEPQKLIPATKLRLVAAQTGAQSAADAGLARDDLKAISGIGPKLEKILYGLGLRTYAQIAALDKAQIARLDRQLGFAGRIGRDDWIGQATALAAGK